MVTENKPWTVNEFLHFVFMTVLSGGMIGICATSSLYANAVIEGGKLIGAVLFSLGIFVILQYEMKLFTGLVSTIPSMKKRNLWKLPTCFIGNAIGVFIVYLLVSATPLGKTVILYGKVLVDTKFAVENWWVSAVSSGVLCGVLITLSVLSVNHAHKKGLSANVGVIFPIIVFAFCGFDHSVANMFYFYCASEFSLRVIAYVLLTILGNVIGGVLLPVVINLKDSDEL
ncbi:MAG: formate/nitrite transporter family protein [Clostridia bacterium]|nr:formate/nitrite transporter family protein [Clostridia bacterium]